MTRPINWLLIARQYDEMVKRAGDDPAPIGRERDARDVAFSPGWAQDGLRLQADRTLRLWDAASDQPVGEPLHGHEAAVSSVAFSPDGRRIVSGSADRTLRLWDARYLATPLPELATEAEKLCPLSRREQETLHLLDPQLGEQAQELTADQRRACGRDNEP